MFAPPHSAHDHFVVLLEESTLHLELLIDFASLAEVNELALVVASLVPIVHIVTILN